MHSKRFTIYLVRKHFFSAEYRSSAFETSSANVTSIVSDKHYVSVFVIVLDVFLALSLASLANQPTQQQAHSALNFAVFTFVDSIFSYAFSISVYTVNSARQQLGSQVTGIAKENTTQRTNQITYSPTAKIGQNVG